MCLKLGCPGASGLGFEVCLGFRGLGFRIESFRFRVFGVPDSQISSPGMGLSRKPLQPQTPSRSSVQMWPFTKHVLMTQLRV